MNDSESKQKMAEAADKLGTALDSAGKSDEEGGADGSVEETVDDLPETGDLIERAEGDVESLLSVLNGEESFVDAREDIEDLLRVIEETGELLDTVDLTQLPDAIDLTELPEAVETGELPSAIASLEPERAVELSQLASLVEFNELWGSVDVREFIRNKEELEDAADDATDDGDEDLGMLDSVTPSDSTDGDDTEDDGGMMDSMGSSGPDTSGSSGDGSTLTEQKQAAQAAIQSQLRDAIGEFRESVLDARGKVKEARDTTSEKIEEKTGGDIGQPSSRNPTAFSTMTSGWKTGGWSSAGYSTVPAETRHSNAPNHVRLYGSRFDGIEREDDDE